MYGWNQSAVNHRFAVSMVDEQEDYGQVSNSVLFESSFDKEDYRVGMQMGALIENGSFLGGSRNGAFGVDETATYYLGLNGSYDLSDKISLLGGFFHGMSSVDDSSNSLISDVSGVRTQGYALGMLVDDLFSPKGSFGLSYSSPMQTTSGSATLTLPVSQNQRTGAIGFESSNLSFETGDREQVIEAYYNYDVNRKNSIFTHFSHTRNPLTNLDASSNNIVFVGWRHSLN